VVLILSMLVLLEANVNFQELYVFAMNNKAPSPSANISNKCSCIFSHFPSLERCLAGEQSVHWTRANRLGIPNLFRFAAHVIVDLFAAHPFIVMKYELMKKIYTIIHECK
jgi:hypothetical protein